MIFPLERSRGLSFALVAVLATSASLRAEEQKALTFGSDVLVQVPVFVSGRGGGAVSGLTAADFSVQQDGKDVEIVSFRYIDTTALEPPAPSRSKRC